MSNTLLYSKTTEKKTLRALLSVMNERKVRAKNRKVAVYIFSIDEIKVGTNYSIISKRKRHSVDVCISWLTIYINYISFS